MEPIPPKLFPLISSVYGRLIRLWQFPCESFRSHHYLFSNKFGIEFGGPSRIFSRRGYFPVYPIAAQLDNCNFNADTVWEGHINAGRTFKFNFKKKPGQQFIAEATATDYLPAETYDFVLSSHVLEHIANPILALMQWKRLLKDDGALVLVVPDKNYTFDHRRPVTSFKHLVEDYTNHTNENDQTHLPEIIALHDLSRDPAAGNIESLKLRCLENFQNRCMHHHVFDLKLTVEIVKYVGFEVLATNMLKPHHILVVARKSAIGHS